MKKIFLCLISLILVLSSLLSFTACDSEEPPAAEKPTGTETTAAPTEEETTEEETTEEETTAAEEITGAYTDEDGKYPILNKLTVAAIGDSYIAGTGGKWPDILAQKYGMRYYNYGISGSTVSSYVSDRNPMVKRYQEMAAVDANIVIIEGGRNDFNAYTPIGNVDSRNPITFSGALNIIIDASKEKYPDAMIVLITPWNFPDKDTHPMTYLHYVNAMLAVAEYQGERVYCINASDTSLTGVDMRSSSFRRTYCLKESDVSHLNSRGMQMVAPRFEKILAEYYADFLIHKK